jgi:hypothetical protein
MDCADQNGGYTGYRVLNRTSDACQTGVEAQGAASSQTRSTISINRAEADIVMKSIPLIEGRVNENEYNRVITTLVPGYSICCSANFPGVSPKTLSLVRLIRSTCTKYNFQINGTTRAVTRSG